MKTHEIIKELLEENKLSQEQLAKILNVSQKAISNWVNEIDTPKASSMLLIYEKFGITPNELLGLEELKEIPYTTLKKNQNDGNILINRYKNNRRNLS